MSYTSIPAPFHLYSQTTLAICHVLVRGLHFFIRLSAPISYLTTIGFMVFIALYTLPSTPARFWPLAYLFVYSLADSILHLHFIYCLRLLNSPQFALPRIYPTPSERQRVLRGVLASFEHGKEIRECLRHWFYRPNPSTLKWDGRSGQVSFEDLRRENVKEFIASILFSSTPDQLDKAQAAELDDDVDLVASVLEHVFPEGRAESMQCMRPNLEPIKAEPLNVIPTVHKLANSSALEPDMDIHTGEKERTRKWHTIYHASNMRPKVLTLDEQALGMRKMFRRHGFCPLSESSVQQQGGAFVIGHSLGTLLTSYFEREESDWVAGALAIDPVSVLTFLPDLVRTFVYATPQTLGELLVRLIAREIGICTVIQRHFFWFQFVTLEPNSRTHYILSEDDALVNHQKVVAYLNRHSIPTTTLQGTPHGGFLFHHLPAVFERTCSLIQQVPHRAPFPLSRIPQHDPRVASQFSPPSPLHKSQSSGSLIDTLPHWRHSSDPYQPSPSPLSFPAPRGMTVSFSFTDLALVELGTRPLPTRRRITPQLGLSYPYPKVQCN